MVKSFKRTQEDFICSCCGHHVKGNGYTNHCPFCLTSKHVDISPGDRACSCQGEMPAVSLEIKNGEYIITHKCSVCGCIKRNKAQKEDSFEALKALSNGTLSEYVRHLK